MIDETINLTPRKCRFIERKWDMAAPSRLHNIAVGTRRNDMPDFTLDAFSRHWWTFVVQGVLLIVFGLAALFLPGITITALILLFGVFAVADGALTLVFGLRSRRLSLVLLAALAIAAGVIAVLWPGVTAFVLLLLIAAWAIVRGAFALVAAYQWRRVIDSEWLLAATGVALIGLGVVLFLFPGAGLLGLVWLLGLLALGAGILTLIAGFRLRRLGGREAHAH